MKIGLRTEGFLATWWLWVRLSGRRLSRLVRWRRRGVAARYRTVRSRYRYRAGRRRSARKPLTWLTLWRVSLPSPLTLRILAVNLLAPALLLVGLLYLDQYERALVQSDLESLKTYASLLAAAIGEGAVTADVETIQGLRVPVTSHRLEPDQSRSMVRRLAQLGGTRARLFDPSGQLVADSRRLVGPGGAIQVYDLPPIEPPSLSSDLHAIYNWAKRWSTSLHTLPVYRERSDQTAADYDEVEAAMDNGTPATMIRQIDRRSRVLSAAVPVQYYKQIVGAVMVSKTDSDVAQSMFEIRLAILKLFLGTLGVTVLMSLYLARTIARPVRMLAASAEQAGQEGQGREIPIPDLSRRRDEIGDLSVSLREMTGALWARMDAIERFAADVAHEIKNPLTSMRSAVETVVRIRDPEKQARLLAILQDDVGRLDRLISDISDASRLDAELSRAVASRVAMRPILDTLSEVYAPAAEERKVSVVVFAPTLDALEVHGMEARLVQVLRNLIGNALSFSPEGGSIRLNGHREGDMVVLTVDDDGPGIPAGKEAAIFDRFYSERPEGEKFGTHSGLGLSISKQIVEAHRGTITASNRKSPEGDKVLGARFIVRLPAVSAEG